MRGRALAIGLLVALVACGGGPGGAPSLPGAAPSGGVGALAEKVLAADAKPPKNRDLLDSDVWYPSAAPMQRINTVRTVTEAAGRAILTDLLDSRIADPAARASALARYDAAATKTMVADPGLRAALAYTGARFGESLLPTTPPFSTIRVGGSPALATAVPVSAYIVFNRNTLPEVEALPALIEHEAMHIDAPNSTAEDAILNAHTSARYFQALLDNPSLAYVVTAGARRLNNQLFLLLNSRDASSAVIRLQASARRGVAPGGAKAVKNFWDVGWLLGPDAGETPMPAAFRDVIARELEGQAEVPKALNFDVSSGELFDLVLARWMTPVERVRVLVLLQAISLADVARLSGLSEERAIETFGLQRFLDAMRR